MVLNPLGRPGEIWPMKMEKTVSVIGRVELTHYRRDSWLDPRFRDWDSLSELQAWTDQ